MIFVRKLDRYVLWQFLKTLVLAQISLTIITTLVHLMDHINVYLDRNAAWGDVATYYLMQLPYTNLLTLPMSMLIATVLTMGELGRHGELTAMKASGISLYRTAAPLFAFGLVTSVGVLLVGETVVPEINQRSNVVYDQEILGRQVEYENYRGSFVYQNTDGYTYIVRSLFVEDSVSSADQVEIQRRDRDGTFLRINASQMVWQEDTDLWALQNGEIRIFPGLRVGTSEGAVRDTAAASGDTAPGTGGDTTRTRGETTAGGEARSTAAIDTTVAATAGSTADTAGTDDRAVRERMYAFRILRSPHLDDRPQELLAREKDPEELGYVDLQEYVEERERLGAETIQERVDLHMKLAYPFANFVIVLFGVALVGSSAHAGRQSASAGFGVALFLTIVFWGFIRVGQGIGYGGGLEPPVAAWLANGVFGAVAVGLLFRART
ncbi:MAG: LptF/LptG family permease [Gemmatimonadota bacterium]|nr:LptF/LptG family permease [Gemmatimonadota bacterium]